MGNKIREIRLIKNISLNKLAKMTGISIGYLSDIENNKAQNPTMDKLNKIAEALEVSINDFLGDDYNSNNNNDSEIFSEMMVSKLKKHGIYNNSMSLEDKENLSDKIIDLLKIIHK